MKDLQQGVFDGLGNPHAVWEIYGKLLDLYAESSFTVQQVALETGYSKTLVKSVLHRLIQHKAVEHARTDHWGTRYYRMNKAFIGG